MTDQDDRLPDARPTTPSPPGWLNAALTGVTMASVLVAALEHQGTPPDPVEDIIWILVLLGCTSLIRTYAGVVGARARYSATAYHLRRLLGNEWALVTAGLPTVLVLLVTTMAHWPTRPAVQVVMLMNVVLLFGLGTVGALRTRYRPVKAAAVGLADALLGVFVIVLNNAVR